MEDKKLDTINKLFDELVLEAKLAFIKRFSYLENTEATAISFFHANEIVRNVPETDGSVLVHIKGYLIVPFDTFRQLLLDMRISHCNYKIDCMYDDKTIRLVLKRFYYHTKKKFIFSM
jgi:hypothetical protein